MNKLKTIVTNICRFIIALTFIFSGFAKAVDPIGTQYKIQDYLEALSLQNFAPDWATLGASVLLSALEFCIGIFLLFAIRRRLISRIALGLMIFMTGVSLWLAIGNPISDCGCFGDALKLTNGQTLIKNIILLVSSVIITAWPLRMMRFISKSNQWIIINYSIAFILIVSLYCLYKLPLFDFRPYHVGANIREGMMFPEDSEQPEFETTFILEKNGEQKEFTLDNYPDSTWTFVDAKTIQTKKGFAPPIHDFSIVSKETNEDIAEQVLNDSTYVFLLISPYLEQADDSNFGDIDMIYEYATEQGYPFYCLTASSDNAISQWKDLTGAEYPFFTTDAVTLQTIIRSNPGLVLLKNGAIINKWSHNDLPEKNELEQPLAQLSVGQTSENGNAKKLTYIFLWFILPLVLLTTADRIWAWSKWIKSKKISDKYIHKLKKHNKMRKKIVAGNWKMNMNLQEGIALAKDINEALKADMPNCDVVICTPFIHLSRLSDVLDQNIAGFGAENCADKDKGAFTGEVSAEMIKSTGAQYVILGHSERRQYYHETPAILKEKVLLALKNNLKVIFCIGETLEEREAEKQNEVVKKELEESLFNLNADQFKNIILAYEPIWAIGTGKTATAEQAEEMHSFIRQTIAGKFGKEVAEDTSVLYGGSCNPSNAPELFAKEDIDGGLIGGASLKCESFKGVIDAWKK